MTIRQSSQLAQRPRTTSTEVSQQRVADDLGSLFAASLKLIAVLDALNLRRVPVPATVGSVGDVGDFAVNTTHIYFCVAPNSWKRAALTTF